MIKITRQEGQEYEGTIYPWRATFRAIIADEFKPEGILGSGILFLSVKSKHDNEMLLYEAGKWKKKPRKQRHVMILTKLLAEYFIKRGGVIDASAGLY